MGLLVKHFLANILFINFTSILNEKPETDVKRTLPFSLFGQPNLFSANQKFTSKSIPVHVIDVILFQHNIKISHKDFKMFELLLWTNNTTVLVQPQSVTRVLGGCVLLVILTEHLCLSVGISQGLEWKALFILSMPLWWSWSQKSVFQNERLFSLFCRTFISFTHLSSDVVFTLKKINNVWFMMFAQFT